jgi:hypothetical protein
MGSCRKSLNLFKYAMKKVHVWNFKLTISYALQFNSIRSIYLLSLISITLVVPTLFLGQNSKLKNGKMSITRK